jgi:hypothetical protein
LKRPAQALGAIAAVFVIRPLNNAADQPAE